MTPDPQVLLALLAVRMRGANAPAKDDIFKKLKPYVSAAMAQQLVCEEKVEKSIIKKGKPAKSKETVLNLTDAGEAYLETHGGTDAQTAAVAAQSHELAAAVAAKASDLEHALRADREALREEVLSSIAKKSKSGNPSKEIKALATKLEALAQGFAKLEASLKQEEGGEVLARIDAAFAALEKKLQSRLRAAGHAEPMPVAKLVQTPIAATKSLRATLREAYETLCLYIEFDSGGVELPRLYHEARKAVPNLTVQEFHQELESLWSKRVLELKILNEVRSAKDPDKAIRRGDNLYYFVFWPNP